MDRASIPCLILGRSDSISTTKTTHGTGETNMERGSAREAAYVIHKSKFTYHSKAEPPDSTTSEITILIRTFRICKSRAGQLLLIDQYPYY
jgi:hypothetical protein